MAAKIRKIYISPLFPAQNFMLFIYFILPYIITIPLCPRGIALSISFQYIHFRVRQETPLPTGKIFFRNSGKIHPVKF